MASPTLSLKTRELIGSDAFSRRRDVFGQHDTVFYPSPTCLTPTEFEEVSQRRVSGFRRTPAYSSMRETRREDIRYELGFRERKMSDNFTSDLNQSDVDYRHTMTERTRRISKLRQEFLSSNLHEPSDQFARAGTRASMPVRTPSGSFKLPPTSVYKFPFAEPYGTPPPSRKIALLTSADVEVDGGEKLQEAETPGNTLSPDSKKTLAELMKRYSPQAKQVDMTLPPTKPRVVGALTKQVSVEPEENTLEIKDNINIENNLEIKEYNVDRTGKAQESQSIKIEEKYETKEKDGVQEAEAKEKKLRKSDCEETINESNSSQNDDELTSVIKVNGLQKDSSDESNEKDDKVPEIPLIFKHEPQPKTSKATDETIPALLEKITQEPPQNGKDKKKIKRKRSFIDKLLNRNKNK